MMRRLVRHELKVRRLEVQAIEPLTPRMLRLTLTGAELEGFESASPDDHVKLLVPAEGVGEPLLPRVEAGRLAWPTEGPRAVARDYTPVRFDPHALELDLELALHPGGHVAAWARRAGPGCIAGLGGPRGSHLFFELLEGEGLVLCGDETALPAMRGILRELPAGVRVLVLVEVQDARERQPLESRAHADVRWLERGEAPPGTTSLLVDALESARYGEDLPDPLRHAWLAGEADAVRRLRRHLCEQRGLPLENVSARGYWKLGTEDHQEPHDD